MKKAILTCLVMISAAFGQTQEEELIRWMDGIAQKHLTARVDNLRSIRTVEQAKARQQEVRTKIFELIGGLPDYNGPLSPKITGRLQRKGYTIEKVIYESLPGILITANVYLPSSPGKHPAILIPMGHWEQGKAAAQRIAANFALKGFVAMPFDPIGQGERLQSYDARIGRSLAGGSVEQHFMAGAQSVLVGQSFARYRIWDARRSLDYLVSRPEVDGERIGVTGCSGGGTLSTYIAALDPRVKAAAPACYMNSFRSLFAGPVGDSEQSIPGFISAGLDLPDYIEAFAPKPWLIGSTRGDFFPIKGAEQAYEEAKDWYRIYGAQDRLKWVVEPGGHGVPRNMREEIYGWMIQWLNDGKGDAKEIDVELVPDYQLQVTEGGQVALAGCRDVFSYIRETKRQPGTTPELKDYVSKWVAYEKRPVTAKSSKPLPNKDGVTREEVTFETEPGLDLKATLLKPAGASGRLPAVIVVNWRSQEPEFATRIAKAGNVVLYLPVRGQIYAAQRQFAGDAILNIRALLIGQALPAMRARDILRAVDLLEGRPDVDARSIGGYGWDYAGIWMLLAATTDSRLTQLWLDHTPYSVKLAMNGPMNMNLHDATLPGFALKWDFQDLIGAVKPRPVVWVDPTDWMRNTVRADGPFDYRLSDPSQEGDPISLPRGITSR